MPNPTLNTGNRELLKPIWLIQEAGDLPADYEVTTLNTYIGNANGNTTRVAILNGTDGTSPSPVTSELTTEGKQVTQAVDVSGTPTIVAQTPTEYNALRSAFHNTEVRLIKCYVASLDTAISKSDGVITLAEGDIIEISHKMKFSFYLNNVSGQEMQASGNFAAQLDADDDTAAAYESVIADS
jgi:hypothetical protein